MIPIAVNGNEREIDRVREIDPVMENGNEREIAPVMATGRAKETDVVTPTGRASSSTAPDEHSKVSIVMRRPTWRP